MVAPPSSWCPHAPRTPTRWPRWTPAPTTTSSSRSRWEELLARLRVATPALGGGCRRRPGRPRLRERRPAHRLRRPHRHPRRRRGSSWPHECQAAGAFQARNTGKVLTAQRHPEGGVGQRPGQRPAVAARVDGHPAQEDRARPRPTPPTSKPMWASATACCGSSTLHRRRARGSSKTVSLGAHAPSPVRRPCPAAGRTPRGGTGARTRSPAPCRTPSCAGTPAASAFPRPP